MAKIKDREVILFNYLTGNFDLSLKFNENRIVTHSYNAAGTLLRTYDSASQTFIESEALVVTDMNGNVVVV